MKTLSLFLFICSIFYWTACQNNTSPPLPSSVKAVLPTLKSQVKPGSYIEYFSDLRLEQLEKELNKNGKGDYKLVLDYAVALLNNGSTGEAIMELEKLKSNAKEKTDASFLYEINKQLAIAYLRMGEQKNCLGNATAATCVFPLDETAIYLDKTGPVQAIDILEALLAEKEADLEAKWLLNLAYMTIGSYPDSVPANFLLSPELFESKSSIGQFKNLADSLGLAHVGLSGGAIMDDFNNDGALDIILSALLWEGQLRYYQNNLNGQFEDITEQAGLIGELGGLHLIQADYDNDGWLDFFVLRGAWFGENGRHPNSLLRNNGDGTFSNRTIEAGLYSAYPTQSAAWADFNRDGWIDLLIVNETDKKIKSPVEFYQNNQDGTFRNLSHEIGLKLFDYYKAVVVTDYNNDLWPDVFVSNIRGNNVFLQNNGLDEKGIVQFEDISEKAGIQQPRKSFPSWAWDFDNDGLEDLLTISYSYDHTHMYEDLMGLEVSGGAPSGIYKNNGDGTYTNVAAQLALDRPLYAMAGNFGDFDNDGYLDFFLGTGAPSMGTLVPNRMMRNVGGTHFEDITYSAGVGNLQKGHSTAIGDLDNDGDQDLYVVLGGIYATDVFQNVMLINPGQGNNWVNLKLEGTKSNRAAIGSKIELTIVEDGQERRLFHTVSSGGSFGSSSLQQEIGLGKAKEISQLRIIWAGSGIIEEFQNLAVNKSFQIVEGSQQIEERILKRIEI